MTDNKYGKECIYISHTEKEKMLARFLKQFIYERIQRRLDNGENDQGPHHTIVTSDDISQMPSKNGEQPNEEIFIFDQLYPANVAIFLCSRYSLEQEKIHVDAGKVDALNTASSDSQMFIQTIPVCHSGLGPEDLPVYLSSNQGLTVIAEQGLFTNDELRKKNKKGIEKDAEHLAQFGLVLIENIVRLFNARLDLVGLPGNKNKPSFRYEAAAHGGDKKSGDSFQTLWDAHWADDAENFVDTLGEDQTKSCNPRKETSEQLSDISRRLWDLYCTGETTAFGPNSSKSASHIALKCIDLTVSASKRSGIESRKQASSQYESQATDKESHSTVADIQLAASWENLIREMNGLTRPNHMIENRFNIQSYASFGVVTFLYDGYDFYLGLKKHDNVFSPGATHIHLSEIPTITPSDQSSPSLKIPWFHLNQAKATEPANSANNVDVQEIASELEEYLVDRMSSMGLRLWQIDYTANSNESVEGINTKNTKGLVTSFVLVNESDVLPRLEIYSIKVIDIRNLTGDPAYNPKDFFDIKDDDSQQPIFNLCTCQGNTRHANLPEIAYEKKLIKHLDGDYIFAKDGKIKYWYFQDATKISSDGKLTSPEQILVPINEEYNITPNALVCDHYLLAEYGCCRSYTPFISDEESGGTMTKELFSVTSRTLLTCF